ncbi:helix-turn-helix domain-containing protein [Blastococcus atacamensis]|uniref:helix-turn-helix domain-containing protein n=1 Tax=Blastococcus atacamensis TaxID=2070508 RepID=UPI000CEC55E0|nr:helix-turn-helix transcriptional regulator [Blastococcus atacamensis]
MPDVSRLDVSAALRRIRRTADLSQRQIAERAGISKSAIARAESGSAGLDVDALAACAALAGLRIALLDSEGREVGGMIRDAVRDGAGRRFPAHLDPVLSDEERGRWEHRRDREQPTYTFSRRSPWQEPDVRAADRPTDHPRPQPGDSPTERRAARRAAIARARAEERRRLFERNALLPLDDGWTCTCPAACDELEDWAAKPVHAAGCPCRCDVG